MDKLPTIAIKNGEKDYKIINLKDFDEKKGHVKFDGVLPRDTVTSLDRNADGTFSEPTPTDIRYPNKDLTEFANNHGAYIHKNAAEMRADMGLPDAPGGLSPDPVLAEAVKDKEDAEKKAGVAGTSASKTADEPAKAPAKK